MIITFISIANGKQPILTLLTTLLQTHDTVMTFVSIAKLKYPNYTLMKNTGYYNTNFSPHTRMQGFFELILLTITDMTVIIMIFFSVDNVKQPIYQA